MNSEPSTPARIYLVGTDTGVGKTTVACELLRSAMRHGIPAVPFKPAMSGRAGPQSDVRRLIAAAGLRDVQLNEVAPLRYLQPLAPGLADDSAPFLGRGPSATDAHGALAKVQWALARLEQHSQARLAIIEGVGGLEVPMPGGTWQAQWISALGARPVVVGRAGLGTINHTLLTIEALRARGLEPLGFFLVQRGAQNDPSRSTNRQVISQRSGLDCLGELPYLGKPPRFAEPDQFPHASTWPILLNPH